MYPAGDLSQIEARKHRIRRRIARHRERCVDSAMVLTEPLEQLNRLHAQWRRIAPLVKALVIPAGFLFARKSKRNGSLLSTLVKWLPTAWQIFRDFRAATTPPPPDAMPAGATTD